MQNKEKKNPRLRDYEKYLPFAFAFPQAPDEWLAFSAHTDSFANYIKGEQLWDVAFYPEQGGSGRGRKPKHWVFIRDCVVWLGYLRQFPTDAEPRYEACMLHENETVGPPDELTPDENRYINWALARLHAIHAGLNLDAAVEYSTKVLAQEYATEFAPLRVGPWPLLPSMVQDGKDWVWVDAASVERQTELRHAHAGNCDNIPRLQRINLPNHTFQPQEPSVVALTRKGRRNDVSVILDGQSESRPDEALLLNEIELLRDRVDLRTSRYVEHISNLSNDRAVRALERLVAIMNYPALYPQVVYDGPPVKSMIHGLECNVCLRRLMRASGWTTDHNLDLDELENFIEFLSLSSRVTISQKAPILTLDKDSKFFKKVGETLQHIPLIWFDYAKNITEIRLERNASIPIFLYVAQFDLHRPKALERGFWRPEWHGRPALLPLLSAIYKRSSEVKYHRRSQATVQIWPTVDIVTMAGISWLAARKGQKKKHATEAYRVLSELKQAGLIDFRFCSRIEDETPIEVELWVTRHR